MGRWSGPAAGSLAAETRKLLSLPSSAVTVLVTAAVTAMIGWSLAQADPAGRPPTAAQVLVIGHNLAAPGFLVLGVLVGTSEYAAGQVTTTLAAVPRRGLVLAAKAAALTGVAGISAVGLLAVLAAPYPGTVLVGVLVAAVALASISVLGAAVGLLLRQLVPALVMALAVLTILPMVLASLGLPVWWVPSDAAAAVVDAGSGAAPWASRPLLVLAVWLAAVWAAAAGAFLRRDA